MSRDPVLVLRGEKVGLGPIDPSMIDDWVVWMNDLAVTRFVLNAPGSPWTREMEQAWYDRARDDRTQRVFAIFELATGRAIGTCGLKDLDLLAGTATFGIMIGAKDCWNRGYGTEATRLTLDFGFSVLGLHNVDLRVHARNPRAIRAYERAGFRTIGQRRGAILQAGRRHDTVLMDAIATEFVSPVAAAILNAD
jgi:RimJ/RimL family protein N-acetyltransferase